MLCFEAFYNDALRHLVATAYIADLTVPWIGDWPAIAELMDLDEEEVRNIFPWQLRWIGQPGAEPPNDKTKLEGKGWFEWRVPGPAVHTDDAWFKAHTHLAMPRHRLPWKKGERRAMEGWETVDLGEVKKEVRVEAASGEWVGEIVAKLRE